MDSPKSEQKVPQPAGTVRTSLILSPLHKANRQTALFLDAQLSPHGLSAPEAHLLGYVERYGPCPVGELVRVLGFKRSTTTSMLDRLDRLGAIHRELHPQDRRSFLVAVTPAGRQLAAAAVSALRQLEMAVRAELSAADLEGFSRVLAAIDRITGINVRQSNDSSPTPPSTPKPRRAPR